VVRRVVAAKNLPSKVSDERKTAFLLSGARILDEANVNKKKEEFPSESEDVTQELRAKKT